MKAVCVARTCRVQLRPRKLDTLTESVIVFIDRIDGWHGIRVAGIYHQAGNIKTRTYLVKIGSSGAGKENSAYCIIDTLKRQGELVGVDFPLFIRRV
ncbi:Uncharacterised protein [Enterobacter hormaechei]|nr:Uncharacterised protein [Enterobacter hormaechei]